MDKYFWLKMSLNFLELIAFVAGITHWRKVRSSYWKWFVVYCGVIFFTELTGKYVGYVLKNPRLNADIYFFFGIPVQFVFFCWLFYHWLENRKDRFVPVAGVILYIMAWMVELLFLREKRMGFSSFSYLIGNIVLLVVLVISFLRFVNSNEVLHYRKSMLFWVGTGMLVFYIGTLPFYGLRNYLYYNYKQIFYPYWDITYILDCLMYLFFSFAFIWGKPK